MQILNGDCLAVLKTLPDNSVHTCVTSPPYWGLRDYGVAGQLGLERTPEQYVQKMVEVFREVRRVLREDGTLWLNLGDSYLNRTVGKRSGGNLDQWKNGGRRDPSVGDSPIIRDAGLKPKDLVGIPWRVAFALQADGWYLRQDIVWHKPNPMPESVTDRCTKAHEYIFLLSKSDRYFFDHEAIKEPAKSAAEARWAGNASGLNSSQSWKGAGKSTRRFGAGENASLRNRRSVWMVSSKPFKGAHFATFPRDLIEPCVLAGAPKGGTVLDPFFGAGTTGLVAEKHGRECIGIELNPAYVAIASERLSKAKA